MKQRVIPSQKNRLSRPANITPRRRRQKRNKEWNPSRRDCRSIAAATFPAAAQIISLTRRRRRPRMREAEKNWFFQPPIWRDGEKRCDLHCREEKFEMLGRKNVFVLEPFLGILLSQQEKSGELLACGFCKCTITKTNTTSYVVSFSQNFGLGQTYAHLKNNTSSISFLIVMRPNKCAWNKTRVRFVCCTACPCPSFSFYFIYLPQKSNNSYIFMDNNSSSSRIGNFTSIFYKNLKSNTH